jgi:phosphate transport system substrate-binding protein
MRHCKLFLFTLLLGATTAHAALPDQAGAVRIDGSSTVYPIMEAMAEDFGTTNRSVKVLIGVSGTGGGFKKFCAGETDISNASRPIKDTEIQACTAKGINYIELPVAYDALTVVVNRKNSWASSMTIAELKKIWEPEAQGKITRWSQVRAGWPDAEIKLFGAGVDSGTYDYFTEAVVGKEHSSRGDYTSSEDDNIIVQGVANDENALGFMGLAYYEENKDKLVAVGIDDEKISNGTGPQIPSAATVLSAAYQPLSRPLFIYVRQDAAARGEVKAFVNFVVQNAPRLVAEVGYVPLKQGVYDRVAKRFSDGLLGSVFGKHGSQVGVSLEQVL